MSDSHREGIDGRLVVARSVRAFRAARGTSRSSLALDAGIDPGHLRRIEEGAVDPRLSTLERLSSALRVSLAELFATGSRPDAPPPPPMSLGAALRRARVERGYTRAALGARARVSPQYLQRVEEDRQSPTVRVLLRVASALGCAPGALIDGVTPPDARD